MTEEKHRMICFRCQVELELKKTDFTYLGHSFFTELPCCPGCGIVYISEELVRNRISQVEMQLEDK